MKSKLKSALAFALLPIAIITYAVAIRWDRRRANEPEDTNQ